MEPELIKVGGMNSFIKLFENFLGAKKQGRLRVIKNYKKGNA